MKSCVKCGSTNRIGIVKNGRCRPCQKLINANYRLKNRKSILANSKKYRQINAKQIALEKRKANRIKLGWVIGEHELAETNLMNVKKCACCQSTKHWHLNWQADHNHKTGFFRAHVCYSCNIIVGFIEKGHQLAKHYPLQSTYLDFYSGVYK